jgi:hypothetical protein
MIGYDYHYWLRTLLANLELRETIVRVLPGQTITVKEKGSESAQTFISGTTLRIEDPETLFIDGLQAPDPASLKIVRMQVPWDAILSMGFLHEATKPRQRPDRTRR